MDSCHACIGSCVFFYWRAKRASNRRFEGAARKGQSGKRRCPRGVARTLEALSEKGGKLMKCPFCGHENTRVIDSRPADDNNSIRRRRVCDECDKRFTTYEKVETIPLIVIKKDDNRETYDRSKIEAGVLRACHKRPISANQIKQLVDDVETEIFSSEEKEIPSRVIGELVMNKLKDLEAVAYVRFASVYREFKDINTFMDELKKVLE